jgi:hypothetical protein
MDVSPRCQNFKNLEVKGATKPPAHLHRAHEDGLVKSSLALTRTVKDPQAHTGGRSSL